VLQVVEDDVDVFGESRTVGPFREHFPQSGDASGEFFDFFVIGFQQSFGSVDGCLSQARHYSFDARGFSWKSVLDFFYAVFDERDVYLAHCFEEKE
jgi:hypothetical protein